MTSKELELLFLARGYTWKIGGESKYPTAEDIQKVIDHAVRTLDNEPDDDVQLEIGRLIFKKRDNTIDLFVYFGEVNA